MSGDEGFREEGSRLVGKRGLPAGKLRGRLLTCGCGTRFLS